MKHIKFPSIEQFRNIVGAVNREYSFAGLDVNGDAIYDNSKGKPTLKFKGTVKLHGTNGAVCYNEIDGIWAQSKENIITIHKDNAGFAMFVESHKDALLNIFNQIKENHNVNTKTHSIALYCEWVGKGIQSKVAICQLEKSMFIIGVKIAPNDNEEKSIWVDSSNYRDHSHRIFNIDDYQTFEVDINFNMPQLVQNHIIDLTLEVERECPVGKAFGIEGIGEGIVFMHVKDDKTRYIFKSKGEKHAGKSKVKVLNKVDDVKLQSILDTVDKVTPIWRLEQMFEQQFGLMNGGAIDKKKMGDYIRLVINDILKEDLDIIIEAGLEPKDINKHVSEIARKYFFERESQSVGL